MNLLIIYYLHYLQMKYSIQIIMKLDSLAMFLKSNDDFRMNMITCVKAGCCCCVG